MAAKVVHVRRGPVVHALRHRADYLLLDPDAVAPLPFFSVGRWNLMSWHASDHGGARGQGRGAPWAREVLAAAGLADAGRITLQLLTQPRSCGVWFTPVSFWLARRGDDLIAVIAEVNNTFGQRHSYLCATPGFAPIEASDEIEAAKLFHVSPFQRIAGRYLFRFALGPGRVAILIRLEDGAQGMVASMTGRLEPLTPARVLAATIRRPFGPLRILALIYFHALRLRLKGALYHSPPSPPDTEVSR